MSRARIIIASLISLLALGPACATDEGGEPHPTDQLGYPVSVTADPGGRILWVVSGNFDLAYRGGAVLAIDVATQQFVREAAFEVGGFPGPLHLLERDGRAVAGYILSRDADALYYATLDGPPEAPVVACPGGRRATAAGASGILQCPEGRALASRTVRRDGEEASLRTGTDPFGALVRHARTPSEPDLLVTGAMASGTLATWDLDEAGVPELSGNLSLPNGLFAFAEAPSTGRIYATSKTSNAFQVLAMRPAADLGVDLASPWLRGIGQVLIPEAIAGDRARDVAVSTDGTRLYATYRSPASLVVIDISEDGLGQPHQRVIHKIPLSRDPGDIVVVPGPGPDDERVYVSCFGANRVDVVDPRAGQVVASIRTGRGPYGMALVDNPSLDLRRLYVALFREHAVGVIELDPASPYFHTVVAEIR